MQDDPLENDPPGGMIDQPNGGTPSQQNKRKPYDEVVRFFRHIQQWYRDHHPETAKHYLCVGYAAIKRVIGWLWERRPGSNQTLALATIILVCIGVYAVRQTDEALRTTRENFQAEERPYIWLKDIVQGPDLIQEGKVAWTYVYFNYGKTPALNVRGFAQIKVAAGDFTTVNLGPIDFAPLPPGKTDFATARSRTKFNRDQFNAALKTAGDGITITGFITYTDASGGKYETDFCLRTLTNQAISYCSDGFGNNIK